MYGLLWRLLTTYEPVGTIEYRNKEVIGEKKVRAIIRRCTDKEVYFRWLIYFKLLKIIVQHINQKK